MMLPTVKRSLTPLQYGIIQFMTTNCQIIMDEFSVCLPERTAEAAVVASCVGQPAGESCRWVWSDE